MRILALFLLACTGTASSQDKTFINDSAYVRMIGLPETISRSVTLQAPYVYISSDNDLYDFFGYDTAMKHRDFDFAHFHIFGQYVCRQCLFTCNHQMQCHRNRCQYSWVWTVRDNQKAFRRISAMQSPAGRDDLTGYRDSVMQPLKVADSGYARWYTHAGGDCHAYHTYQLFMDQFYPTMLMKEWNHYGGCRAGGFWVNMLKFIPPPEAKYFLKNTILVDR